MPHINEMRNQFDELSVNDKYEYITQLKEYIEKNGGRPEHREFLTECMHKYNSEVQNTQQPNGISISEASPDQYQEPVQQAPQQPAQHMSSQTGWV